MPYKTNRKLVLSLAIAAAVPVSHGQSAGEESSIEEQKSEATMEEVVTTGSPLRDSKQQALEEKRYADNFKEVISADAIGRFPDENLADSMGRIPGVAVERDQGQARFINLRGTPFRYTSIAFDGISVPGADNGRVPRFDSIPSAIISSVEVNKAVLPSMPGEAVAGHVNIDTFSPFDREGASFAADIGRGRQDLGDGDVERASLRGSWSSDNFGIMAFGSRNSREQVTDNREYDLDIDENSGDVVVNELDLRNYRIERQSTAYGGRIEYRGDGALKRLFLNSLYSEFEDEEERNQYEFTPTTPQPGNTGTGRDAGIQRLLEFGTYENSTLTNTLGSDFKLADWELEARYSRIETEFDTFLPIPLSAGGTGTIGYDVSDRLDPKVDLSGDLSDVQYASNLAFLFQQVLDIDNDQFKLDATYPTDLFGGPSELAIGAQYDTREANGGNDTAVRPFPESINIGSFDTGQPWATDHTTNTIGGTYFDNRGLRSAWEQSGDFPDPEISEDSVIALEEDIAAAYGMITTNYSWGSLTSGVRVENTDYTSKGTLDGEAIDFNDSFTNVLPSVHANIDIDTDQVLRFSASSGVNRPGYDEWRASANVDPTNRTVTGGNPRLEEERAYGADISYEWYFAPVSLFSAGVFYRTIDNVIFTDVTTVDGGLYLDSAAGQEWELNGPINGDDGEFSGLELNLTVQDLADITAIPVRGFGFSANGTLVDSEFKAPDGRKFDLPGTSDLSWNASVFYENYGFSARVNYQFRDEWVSPVEDPEDKWGEQERVDASLSYQLPLNQTGVAVSLYAEANNLTEEVDTRFSGNGTINQSESFGRRYLAGIRLDY